MPQDLIDYGRQVMLDHGIVDSGDAKRLGIGAMTDARWAAFYDGDGGGRRLSQGDRRARGLHAALRRSCRGAWRGATDRDEGGAIAMAAPPAWKGLDTARMPRFIGYDQAERMLNALRDRAARLEARSGGRHRARRPGAGEHGGEPARPAARHAVASRAAARCPGWVRCRTARRVLLIDDACSTGETMRTARAALAAEGRDCLTMTVAHDPERTALRAGSVASGHGIVPLSVGARGGDAQLPRRPCRRRAAGPRRPRRRSSAWTWTACSCPTCRARSTRPGWRRRWRPAPRWPRSRICRCSIRPARW